MTNTERPLDLAVVDADRAAGSASAGLAHAWQYAGDRPLDLGGPTDIPFEPFDDGAIERSIVSRFHEIAERYPTRTAIDDGKTRLTYAEVWRIACNLARQVERLVPAGRPVAVVLPNATLFPVAALACLAVGRPYVPIDLDYPAARNAEILREAGMAAAITEPGLPAADALIPASLPRIYADVANALAAAEEPPLDPVGSGGPAVILFTSGSTGRPKGICNNQRALLLRIAHYTNTCHLNAEDRLILLHSPSTTPGVRQTLAALLNGATLRIAELRRLGISGVQRVIREERITVYYSVPAVLRSLLCGAEAKAALAGLRIVRLAGDTTFESDLALCRAVVAPTCHILASFGSTEVPAFFQWFPQPGMGDGLTLPSGFPMPGIAFAMVGPDGVAVPTGEVGELVVRSRYLALGLWQDGRLVPGPIESDQTDADVRILRTGDLFRLRPDGLAEHHGRNDRQVKIRGARVDPGEVEAALRRCDGVADAAVIVRRQNSMDSVLVGFVVPQPGSPQLASKHLRQEVSTWLPAVKCPTIIHVIEEIPRLPSFKPDMSALVRLDQASLSSEEMAETDNIAQAPLPAAPPLRSELQDSTSRNLLEIRPLAGAIGAEILGVDLAGDVDDDTIAAIRRAWLDHLVIFFRDQDLPPARLLALARRFGEPIEYPFVKGLGGFPLITPVVKLAHQQENFGGFWHSDTTYREIPPMGTMLIAREVPPYGGDTLFANMYLAYESLSAGMHHLLDGLVAVNSQPGPTSIKGMLKHAVLARLGYRAKYAAEHPVVRTHPETGRKALYVNSGHTVRFKDMSEEESAPLLRFLFAHLSRPEFTCRFRWEVGSLAFWDNRCAQHNPINDYHGFRRAMHRVTLAGDRPR
jgi:taurine dioxygenase